MSNKPPPTNNHLLVKEMEEFAGFSKRDQYYIRRSLDNYFNQKASLRDLADLYAIDIQFLSEQRKLYNKNLPNIQNNTPYEGDLHSLKGFIEPLVIVSTFDLSQECLSCFSGYRFLYERLLGPDVRPWLPSTFCAAASMPTIPPASRKSLLQSISEAAVTAPGWSQRVPKFIPTYVDLTAN